MLIINRPIKRVFAFGCSFTKYFWSCWPEIIAFDLNVPLYNYGKSGAGNQYIANAITQADCIHKIDQNDLVIVCWTNVCREDRWRKGSWVNTGNIFTQNYLDEKYLLEWADPLGYMIRDLSTIRLVKNFLENKSAQFHMTSMCDITDQIDQCNDKKIDKNQKYFDLQKLYKDELDYLLPSFFKTLWKNDLYNNKLALDKKIYGDFFSDGHPNIKEHLTFLEKTFINHKFNDRTKEVVTAKQKSLEKFLLEKINYLKKSFAIYELSEADYLTSLTNISPSLNSNIL